MRGKAWKESTLFRGIPFAAPPIEDLRWKPPQPVISWKGVRNSLDQPPSCVQNDQGWNHGDYVIGREDCLSLDVRTPSMTGKLPVLVWIHGGSHRTGAGWVYDGQNFARDGVVLVTVNYRLGALGYFAHPALTKAAGAGATGNFGLMDQIAALKWVQRNIAKFGGDPDNVTVFGESAGGMSTLALLATPEAKGLYDKAIVQSGGGWFTPSSLAEKEKEGAAALAHVGVTGTASAAELRAIPVEKLVSLSANYGPFVDGKLMTETASQALARGTFADVPLIIGANSGEDSLMGLRLTPAQIAMVPPAARAVYAEEAVQGDEAVARAVFGDRVFVGAARWVAAKAADGAPAWLYHFSYVGSRFRPAVTRAFHAAEIQYVFEYWGRRTPMSVVSDEDRAMARLMHACWVAFAISGTPKCGDETWPAYDTASDRLMEFGATTGVRTAFRKSRLDAVEAVALPPLALP